MREQRVLCLENRQDVIDKAVEMAKTANTRLYGMGRDLTWLEDEKFRNTLKSRVTLREGGGLDMLVIAAARSGKAEAQAKTFHDEIKAGVGFSDFGQVRVVVADGERLMLGFPATPGIPESLNEVSFGLYMEDHVFAQWLEKRFENAYRTSDKLGQGRLAGFKAWLVQNRYHVVFALLLSVASFLSGMVLTVLRG